MGFNLLTQAL
jgi:chromosome segregation ATPase